MLHKDSGTITILGKDNGEDIALTKEDVGVVMDEVGMPECLTAKQIGNVMKHTFRNWNEDEYVRLLQKLSLPDNKPFKDFSRGMKMKLGIAVALSHGAKLLLLDEPTSGLDPVVRDEVVDMFYDFTRDENHSILISSHIVSDLEKLCDYVAFLHKGKLLLCDFGTNDTYIEKGTYTGDFATGVTITWSHGEWTEKFTHKSGNSATLIDGNGWDWEYKVCDIAKAQKVLDGLNN